MANPYAPPPGPWARPDPKRSSSAAPQSDGGGPWGTLANNPYAPPSELADREIQVSRSGFVHANLGARLGAKLIDRGLTAIATVPGLVLAEYFDTDVGAAVAIIGLLGMLWVEWILTGVSGQSLGKRWLGLRIITDDGRRVGFARGVLLRSWVMYFGSSIALGLPSLLDPLFVFAKDRKALHDHLANTLVIEARTPGDPYA